MPSKKSTPENGKPENIHAGHRARLKAQARENGLHTFNPHQVLELLLFYTIPQRDTNPLAHQLINRFGTLANVFDAEYQDLIRVNGVSDNTATFLKMIPQLTRLYKLSQSESIRRFTSYEEIGTYLSNYYIGIQVEMPIVILLNNAGEMIAPPLVLSEGSGVEAPFRLQTIAGYAINNGARSVILAHNHPNGDAKPSPEDIKITEMLNTVLEPMQIQLYGHFIISKNGFSSSREW